MDKSSGENFVQNILYNISYNFSKFLCNFQNFSEFHIIL